MKIILIGAGSYVFSLSVLNDLIMEHRASDCELALVDIDADVLSIVEGAGRRMAAEAGGGVRISSRQTGLLLCPARIS